MYWHWQLVYEILNFPFSIISGLRTLALARFETMRCMRGAKSPRVTSSEADWRECVPRTAATSSSGSQGSAEAQGVK